MAMPCIQTVRNGIRHSSGFAYVRSPLFSAIAQAARASSPPIFLCAGKSVFDACASNDSYSVPAQTLRCSTPRCLFAEFFDTSVLSSMMDERNMLKNRKLEETQLLSNT